MRRQHDVGRLYRHTACVSPSERGYGVRQHMPSESGAGGQRCATPSYVNPCEKDSRSPFLP